MAKWYGTIAYGLSEDNNDGIWTPKIAKQDMIGEVLSNRWRRQSSSKVNDDISLSVTISIIADEFVNEHCSNILYVTYLGNKWTVTEIEPKYPRLLLTLGGVYNGDE